MLNSDSDVVPFYSAISVPIHNIRAIITRVMKSRENDVDMYTHTHSYAIPSILFYIYLHFAVFFVHFLLGQI